MGKMAKLDSSLQRGLDNGFAFVFGGRVVPAELEEMLKQEAADHCVRTYEGTIEAPHLFRIELSPKDFRNLSQNPALPQNLADLMTRYIRNKGWTVSSAVIVQLELDGGLRTGQLKPHTSLESNPLDQSGFFPADAVNMPVPTPEEQPQDLTENTQEPEVEMNIPQSNSHAATEFIAAQPKAPHGGLTNTHGPTITLLLQDGSSRTYLVQQGRNLIGRGNDVDFRLPDTGVSRHHLEINWDGRDAVLTDLNSTNGTLVNDMPVENWLLADGDVITIGHSYIEVRITGK
ncbi:MAG: DUF3662 and FHA domain-containing protein [Corynebacterium sp.]|nr:DUF3662 and FHA domain-containing protein [Corynebacterium sp.]